MLFLVEEVGMQGRRDRGTKARRTGAPNLLSILALLVALSAPFVPLVVIRLLGRAGSAQHDWPCCAECWILLSSIPLAVQKLRSALYGARWESGPSPKARSRRGGQICRGWRAFPDLGLHDWGARIARAFLLTS